RDASVGVELHLVNAADVLAVAVVDLRTARQHNGIPRHAARSPDDAQFGCLGQIAVEDRHMHRMDEGGQVFDLARRRPDRYGVVFDLFDQLAVDDALAGQQTAGLHDEFAHGLPFRVEDDALDFSRGLPVARLYAASDIKLHGVGPLMRNYVSTLSWQGASSYRRAPAGRAGATVPYHFSRPAGQSGQKSSRGTIGRRSTGLESTSEVT